VLHIRVFFSFMAYLKNMPFKSTLLALTCLCLLASCKDEKQEETTAPEAPATLQVQISDDFTTVKYPNKALILYNDLILYNKDKVAGNKISGLYGLIVDIDSISKDRLALTKTNDKCLQHNFVYLSHPKIKGWVYGQDVFEYLHDDRDTVFTLQDIEFRLYATKNFGVGASDDEGLTFCGDNNPVVLYNSKYKAETFVPMQADTVYNSNYMVMNASDGWEDKLKDARLIDDKLILTIHREYQEGSADITIEIKLLEKGYHGKIIDVVKYDEQ